MPKTSKNQNPNKTQKKESNFVERTRKNVEEKIEPVTAQALLKMWEEDVNVFDLFYIDRRVRQIMEQVFEPVSFFDAEVQKKRMEVLKRAIDEVKKQKVNREINENLENEQRDKRCEPVCKKIVKLLLNDELIYSDEKYFEEAIEQDDELLAQNRIRSFMDGLFAKLELSINKHLKDAGDKLWGCEKEDISMKQLDFILKK